MKVYVVTVLTRDRKYDTISSFRVDSVHTSETSAKVRAWDINGADYEDEAYVDGFEVE